MNKATANVLNSVEINIHFALIDCVTNSKY